MAFEHHSWRPNSRKYHDSATGQFRADHHIGERNTSDDIGGFLPFLLRGATNEIQFHEDSRIEFASDKQVLKKAADTLCSSFKLFVQGYVGGEWVNQPHGIPTRNFHQGEVFRDGGWEVNDRKCTGFLSFPDAALTFGGNKPYDLFVGLEAGGNSQAHLGFRFRAPVSGDMRFAVVLDGIKKLPTDWEWIWSGEGLPAHPRENRKVGIRVKDFVWRWSWEEAPYRDVIKENNPDDTMKISIIIGPFAYTKNEWLTVYPDQWNVTTGTDDSTYYPSTWFEVYTNDYAVCGRSSTDFSCGFRFNTVDIGQGDTITSCLFTGQALAISNAPEGELDFVAADTTSTWSAGNSPHNQTLTGNAVAFNVAAPAAAKTSAELITPLQAVIDRVGWVSENSISLCHINTKGSDSYVAWEDYNSTGTDEAYIVITWTPAAGGDLSINVAETLAFSESMVDRLPLGPISEADTITVGELATMLLGITVSEADTITFAEIVSTSLGINVNEADTIGITEVATILKDIMPILADTFGITEVLTVSPLGGSLLIDLADAFGITSALIILKDIMPSLVDTFGVTEVLTLLKDIMPSLADTFGVGEDLTVTVSDLVASLVKSLADTFGVNEALTILKDIMPSLVDTFGISEVVTMLKDVGIALADTFGINEALTVSGLGVLWTNIILEGINTVDGKFYQIVGRYKER